MTTEEHPTVSVLSLLNDGMAMGELTDFVRLLEFVTGQPLMSHQIGPFVKECAPYLREQFAHLGDMTAPAPVEGESYEQRRDTVNTWVAEKEQLFGKRLAVTAMPPGQWKRLSPFEDVDTVSGPTAVIPFLFGVNTP